jgi:hypothetical protein
MINDAIAFLPHHCTSACQAKIDVNGEMKFRCRKLNNLEVSTDNTRHTFKRLPNKLSEECVQRLIQIGMAEDIEVEKSGYRKTFKSNLAVFHPKRHIPPTNPNGDLNISPVEGYTFANCRSMQNIQVLTQCGGVNKYVCKYIAKLDEQNYVVVRTDKQKNGCLVNIATFLHNTKVTTTKINEEKSRKDNANHPQGRCISHMEILHQLLKYPEVVTNLRFVTIQTMPIELRTGVKIEKPTTPAEDGADFGTVMDAIRNSIGLSEWRQHTLNEKTVMTDLMTSNISIDKISMFSLRPPELRDIIKTPGMYFRWFHVTTKRISRQKLNEMISIELFESSWVDGLQHKVMVRKRALPEIMQYCESIDIRGIDESLTLMIALFTDINKELQSDVVLNESFRSHIEMNLLDDDESFEHLPCPVYSYIKPTLGPQFLHHVLLSMGQFSTEVDLLMHGDIRECFRYAKLIGPSNDEVALQGYSNALLYRWIEEQLQYFPNALRLLGSWIVIAGNLFDSCIVKNEIPISDMPPVQLSSLFGINDESVLTSFQEAKSCLIDAIFEEIGTQTIEDCHIPSKESLMTASKEEPLDWDPVLSFTKNALQSDDSYEEQKLTITICAEAIDSFLNLDDQTIYNKNIGIRGFPGSGKTWCSLYCAIYAISKGLNVTTTAVLAKRAIQIGGCHWHKLFCLPIDKNLSCHRRAELAIMKLLRDPKRLSRILSLNILFCDEMGQVSAEFLATIDLILRRLRETNIYLGGLLIICTLDHTQIQPIDGRPFLTSSHIIPCFKMVCLKHSVRASSDVQFQRIQEIARYSYKKFENEPNLMEEFIQLCSAHLTFVPNWDNPVITPQTMRLYSKRVPAKDAARHFAQRVRSHVNSNDLRERVADDVEKPRYSHLEWSQASESATNTLEQKLKEPRRLLFFKGAIFECTYNEEDKFSQSQMALLLDLPSASALTNWEKIKILVAPPGLREVDYDPMHSKTHYIENGFKEVKIGVAPERTQTLAFNLQARRKQYGLKHHVSMTIHAAMGDTLMKMATTVSMHDTTFSMWDKGQLIVILSRTKEAKNSIFVGSKQDTLNAFKMLVCRKTQWAEYMEQVLELITMNGESNETFQPRIMTPNAFPYRICDIPLPQCNTGFVYMLISLRIRTFTYIGTTKCLSSRLRAHNAGYGATSTEPTHLRPYALLAYVCGFGGGRTDLRFYIENKWKEKRDDVLGQGSVVDARQLALCANDVISSINATQFGISPSELTLVCLFR